MSRLDEILKMKPCIGTRIASPTNEKYELLATEADKLLREKAIRNGLAAEKATRKLRTN